MPDLSILCVTKAESCVLPLLELLSLASRMVGAEFILVADGHKAFDALRHSISDAGLDFDGIYRVETKGYIESVLDSCINLTTGRWIFRIDDDESIPPPLVEWLRAGEYNKADHWKFNRGHLFQSAQWTPSQSAGPVGPGGYYKINEFDVITSPPLWPDHQTRLSTRDKSFGRTHIHCGSPHGGGELAPFPILHHKFVIKSREEREAILKRYDQIQPGAGGGFWQFSVPEQMEEKGEGRVETISYEEFVRRGYTV